VPTWASLCGFWSRRLSPCPFAKMTATASHMTLADEYATMVRPMGYKTGQIFRFDLADADANVTFEPDGLLKAGTFSKLVEKMTGKNAGASCGPGIEKSGILCE
jgi:hypothetical protein